MSQPEDRHLIVRMTRGRLQSGSWPDFVLAYPNVVVGKEGKGLRWRGFAQDVSDADDGFTVSLGDTAADMEACALSPVYQQGILAALQPFLVRQHTTYRCAVTSSQ